MTHFKIGQCEGVMGQIQLPPDTCVDYAYEMTTQTKETCANLIVGSMKKRYLCLCIRNLDKFQLN